MRTADSAHSSSTSTEKYVLWGLLAILALLVAATVILASVPPVDRDALTHHLFVPKLWLQHGGIYEIPEIPFSYYPMNLDLLYTIPLYFGNDIIPKYIHYLFALLTAWLIHRYLNKRLGNVFGLLGAIFFLSIPIIVKLSITVYVDLGLVFFTTASLLLLLQWAEKDFQLRYLLLAGLCCGLAAGTKYNGLISIFALTIFVPIIYQRSAGKDQQSNGKALLYGMIFTVATFVAFSPWLIRNYVWTGNPIYPLHNSLFQKIQQPTVAASQSTTDEAPSALQQITSNGSGAFASRKILYHETWWQALLLPVRFFIEGQDDNPQFFDGKLTPFLLVLSIMAFLLKPSSSQESREKKILLSFALLYFFLTFFQQVLRIRYIVPIVPPLVILSMYGLRGLNDTLIRRTGGNNVKTTTTAMIVTGISCLMVGYNTQYIVNQFSTVAPLPYVRGKISRDQYITAYRPEYAAIQYTNSVLPSDAKVLCIFLGNRGYYMDFQPVFEQPFGPSGLFSEFFKNEHQDILEYIREKGISHVLMRDDLTAQWFKQLRNNDKLLIAPFFQNSSNPLFQKNGHTFFQLSLKN
ncbi:glycosyltransferase family 39 protein [Desulfoprunum benzoelyticum]|uniref:4-amino-4-deoxy-L-arabinose transferase-like glycosyltransferase n=1 Tax=Desulfoprunum benzoelyticum TaxID=1506996 RepID=A0A840V1G6_9BACT|nr:glycosyltransferase family 39 protein [Desulfoprunum benzoelyticum]MBB5347680.1 4-amino-4-deoxy-L-arabinose transferase-like glycosyltransferase [Desulfoprunum benzoelyticum]MBM9529275.1 glycosyltransferase family 39 protein [Desulfoprunum benzoelyticum]